MEQFQNWLNRELNFRGWSQSELARRANITPSTISRILTGDRKIGNDVATSIADALRVPKEEVLRAAGLLTKSNPRDERIERILMRIEELDSQDQEVIDALIETLLERRRGKNAPTPQEAPSMP